MEGEAVNEVQDENIDNGQNYVEVGRIENDDEVIIVQIENPNIANPPDAEPHIRSQDSNPLEQSTADEVNADEGILTPNRKKRKRSSTRKVPVKQIPEPMKDDDDDGLTCSICLDSWEWEGKAEHRLVALKCGHLFGNSCIRRWLQECPAQAKCCPTCKSRAAVKDIRNLFAKKVLALDKSEEYRLQSLVEEERNKCSKYELQINSLMLELNVMKQRCSQLESKIEYARNHGSFSELSTTTVATILNPPNMQRSYRLSLEKNFELNREPGCRAMIYGRRTQSLFVSQKSSGALFPGFGVRTVNIAGQNPNLTSSFLHMATKQIRDLSLDADEELIISASSDKSAKMFSVPNKCQVSVFEPSESVLWAATFDKARTKTLYLGSNGGSTFLYDIRNPQAYLEEFSTLGDCSPVVSINSVPPTNELPCGGFIVCKLKSLWFYEYTAGQQILPIKLIVEGPFVSTTYDEQTHLILIGTRPSGNYPTRYIVANLTKIDQIVILNTINTITGSNALRVMSRSAQIHIGEDTLVSAYMQDTNMLTTWNARTTSKLQSLNISDVIYDICPVYATNKTYLAALSETKCRILQVNSI